MRKVKAVKLNPGNIWSGSRTLAVFTNPTELAFRKGNLKNHYPVEFRGEVFPDCEAIYWRFKKSEPDLMAFMVEFMQAKLLQYPVLMQTIDLSGGIDFLNKCYHKVNGGWWESSHKEDRFMTCLKKAYLSFK